MRTALIYNFLIEANIMASIAIVLMCALRRFLRRQLGNTALCFGWLLVAIRLLLPVSLPNPLINSIRSPFASDAAVRPIAGQIKVRLSDALVRLSYRGRGVVSELAERTYDGVENATLSITLARLYVVGVALVALWFVISNVRFRRRLRADRIEPISGRLLDQYQTMCRQRGVKPVPVYFTDPLPSACLVGVLRPWIALPLTAAPADAIQVLTHEVCHLKNRDHLWGALRLVCCALHWFNPLVWLAASMSRTDCELRCDDRVVEHMSNEDRQAYANVLVLAAARRNAPGLGVLATGMTMTGRRLKTRIATILRGGRPLRWLAVVFAVVASMCLVGAFATAEMRFVPRILRSHPVLTTSRISSAEEAIAYTQTLFAQEEMDGADTSGMHWEVDLVEEDVPCYVVAAPNSVRPQLAAEAMFDLDGNVWGLGWPYYGENWFADEVTLTESEQVDLINDLRSFLAMVNPARAEETMEGAVLGEAMDGDGNRLAQICYWRSPNERANGYDTTAFFTVQIAPITRILDFTIHRGAEGSNG